MTNDTPDSEFSMELFQNYSAGEVFVQGLAGILNQSDVESLIRSQKTINYAADDPTCDACGNLLLEPYVECSDCDANICTGCYSTGRETDNHRSDHGYRIRKNDFPIFENCNWTAKEEKRLLKAISTCGFGNWDEISKIMHTRSELECEEHYKKFYIDNVQCEELNLFPYSTQAMFPQPIIPFMDSQKPDSTRCPKYCERNLAGYNAFRSEFRFNYDRTAENILDCVKEVEHDDDLTAELTVAVGNAYNNRLKERRRRYEILKYQGIIPPHRIMAWAQKFYATMGRNIVERLFPFMQLMTGMQFDAFIERLNLEDELLQKISRLYEYRRQGIRSLYGAHIYKNLKKSDDNNKKDLKSLVQSLHKGVQATQTYESQLPRRKMMPLEIEDLPGYHSLSDDEKDLCSKIRLVPQKYLEVRDLLISENNKMGHLKLFDARRVCRIDVNKTRKVYDFLVRGGFVQMPSL